MYQDGSSPISDLVKFRIKKDWFSELGKRLKHLKRTFKFMTFIEDGLTLYFDVQLYIKECETRIFSRFGDSRRDNRKLLLISSVILNIFRPQNCRYLSNKSWIIRGHKNLRYPQSQFSGQKNDFCYIFEHLSSPKILWYPFEI